MNILFVSATRIGDAILSSGLLAHLIERHPDARVTLACGPSAAPLFAAMPNLERLVVLRKRRMHLHWFDLWRGSVGRFWDIVVDLRGSGLAWSVIARRRYVATTESSDIHRVVQLGRLFGLDPPPAPRVWISAEAEARAKMLQPDGSPVLAIGPTANWAAKEWRAGYFAQLAARLTGPDGPLSGARIAIHGGTDERDRVGAILEATAPDRLIDLMGADLPVAAACMRRSALYVGNDSGLMHLAAASGAPTLGLFGPTQDKLYAPWGSHTAVARTPESFEDLTRGIGAVHRTIGTLMDTLTVDTVEAAARRLLVATRPG